MAVAKRPVLAAADDDDVSSGYSSPEPPKRARTRLDSEDEEESVTVIPQLNGHGAMEKSEYQHGSIVRVAMKNFVTYSSCVFTPGPNLNMIIGPNGTGKSTIVCALALGLGWPTNVLGRAKDVSEFVKHGAERGQIDITLFNKNGPNVTIRREINKRNNSSVWKINGQVKTHKDVLNKTKAFDIQVDNLCQFLPQDRVSEFAQMSPQQLLMETQRAVGGANMVDAHAKLITLGKECKDTKKSMEGDLETIKSNQKRNEVIEKDVIRFKQRERAMKNVRLFEVLVLYKKYGVAKGLYDQAKEGRRTTHARMQEIQQEIQPLKNQHAVKTEAERQLGQQKRDNDAAYQQAQRALKTNATAIDKAESKSDELRKDITRLEAKEKQKLAARRQLEGQITELKEQIDRFRPREDIDQEMAEVIAELTQEVKALRLIKNNISNLQEAQQQLLAESTEINLQYAQKRKELEKLDDIRSQRLEQLGKYDRDLYESVIWLRSNQHVFQKKVFEPACLELNIKNMRYVDVVERVLGVFMKTLVCQTQSDYDLLTRALIDEKKYRINVIAPKPQDLVLDNYMPQVPTSQLSEFGLECYLLEAVDGPSALLAALCNKAFLHTIPMTQRPTANFERIKSSKLFKRYAVGSTMFSLSYSAYSGEALETTTRMRSAQIFTASVDPSQRQRLVEESDQIMTRREVIEAKVKAHSAEDTQLRQQYTNFEPIIKDLERKRDNLKTLNLKNQKLKNELQRLQNELASKEAEVDTTTEREQIERDLRSTVLKRGKLVQENLQHAQNCTKVFSASTLTSLKRIQAHAALQQIETECAEADRRLSDAELDHQEAANRYETAKDEARQTLNTAKAEFANLPQDLNGEFEALLEEPKTLEEVEEDLASENAKVALHQTSGQASVDKYEQRKAEIKKISQQVESKQKRVTKLEEEIATIRGPWYEKLKALVNEINQGYSLSFEQIGCCGEVKLAEHEDYDQWCIEILVKFRDEEKLQKLTGQRQSGGERSVSTIMYLMALQALSKASFRVVDEINQGMDPRNERLMHGQLVEKACRPNTSQYFLITPKLLPNLEYHERMKVLCIFNGEWLEPTVADWGRYIQNRRKFGSFA